MEKKLYKKCNHLSVLLVEDYIPLQEEIACVLEDYFAIVQRASNGQEAFEIFTNYKTNNQKFFDIVITDYEMPLLNGIELIRKIKKTNKNQIFIVISAHQKPEYLIEFINLGILNFLPKPINATNLLNILDKVGDMFIPGAENLFHINGSLVWNKKNKCLLYNNELLNLAKYDLLLFDILIEDFGLICTTQRIVDHFYLHNEDIKVENVRNMVVRLRKKIPEISIQSIYGVGYKLYNS